MATTISNTLISFSGPFSKPSDAFRSCPMSSFPPPPTLRAQQEERSRDSSTHAAHAIPRPVNLPPLSSIDPRQHRPSHSPSPAEAPNLLQQPALIPHVPQYGTLLPSMSQYYGSQLNASGQYVGGPSAPIAVSSAASRFLITPTSDPNSIIAGGRHKKEVKKRTKTGCMTCRKRRIKCDEGHPACRNCVKSKRECLGYDPIFKSQSPSSIQPAPHLQSPGPANAASQLHHPSYTSRANLSRPESSAIGSSPAPFDRADFPPHLHDVHLGRASSVATSTDTMDESNTRSNSRERARLDDQTIRRATQTNIDDLCWIDDQPGTPVSASAHHESQNSEALRMIYHTSFAPGLDRLLETPWFSANGYVSLMSDRSLLTQFENYVAAIPSAPSVANQEARLVWALLCMCRRRPLPGFAGEFINDREDALDGDEVAEKRLDILEALITCRQSASNPLAGSVPEPPPPNPSTGPTTLAQQLQTREQNFWFHVGEFVSTSDTDAHAIERVLSKSRKLLDNFENRDVVYSIMLMRRIGDKWHDKQVDEADDERDTKDWLAAKRFLESEAQGQAMNVVVKRICSMALRAWST